MFLVVFPFSSGAIGLVSVHYPWQRYSGFAVMRQFGVSCDADLKSGTCEAPSSLQMCARSNHEANKWLHASLHANSSEFFPIETRNQNLGSNGVNTAPRLPASKYICQFLVFLYLGFTENTKLLRISFPL